MFKNQTKKEIAIKHYILFFVLTGLLFFAGCKDLTTPDPPDPPVTPDCEKYNTATITFENRSVNNYTMDIYWDGVRLTTLAPWAKSQVYTVAAGEHTMAFRISNSNRNACTVAYPVLVRCTAYAYFCTG